MTAIQWVRSVTRVGKTARHTVVLACAGFVLNGAVVHSSVAQDASLPPPEFTLTDENSVDLLSFELALELTDLSICSKEHPLTITLYPSPSIVDGMVGVSVFHVSDSFFGAVGTNWAPGGSPNCSTP